MISNNFASCIFKINGVFLFLKANSELAWDLMKGGRSKFRRFVLVKAGGYLKTSARLLSA